AGQEAFFDATFRYYDVSGGLADSNLYPTAEGGANWTSKIQWGAGEMATRWATLGVAPAAPVQFRYATTAGLPTEMPNDGIFGTGIDLNLAAVASRPSHWYIALAVGDLDGDGVRSVFIGSSFTNEIFSQNAGERVAFERVRSFTPLQAAIAFSVGGSCLAIAILTFLVHSHTSSLAVPLDGRQRI